MTIKKAIKIIDAAIQNKQIKKAGLLDLTQPWNNSPDNFFTEFVKGLAEIEDYDIKWFQAIKNQLEPKKSGKHTDKKT